jgi:hypothetical protein
MLFPLYFSQFLRFVSFNFRDIAGKVAKLVKRHAQGGFGGVEAESYTPYPQVKLPYARTKK